MSSPKGNALYNPAKFSSLVTSYPPCAGEKISLRSDLEKRVGVSLGGSKSPFAVDHAIAAVADEAQPA